MNSKGPVLLVEDDPSDARLIQRAFAKMDRSVAMFRLTNGDEVVSYLAGYLTKPDTASQLEEMASEFQRYWLSMNESPDLHGTSNQLRRS